MKAKKLFPDSAINSLFNNVPEVDIKDLITVKITADEQLIGKTLTITNGIDSFSEVVPASMEFEFKLNSLGNWTLTNPITDKVQEINIKYYGIHDTADSGYGQSSDLGHREKCDILHPV